MAVGGAESCPPCESTPCLSQPLWHTAGCEKMPPKVSGHRDLFVLCSPEPTTPRRPSPAPAQGLPALGRVGRQRPQHPAATLSGSLWQRGFLCPAEFPNCHRTSVLCHSSSYHFSAQTRQVTVLLHTEIPSSCPKAWDLPQKIRLAPCQGS